MSSGSLESRATIGNGALKFGADVGVGLMEPILNEPETLPSLTNIYPFSLLVERPIAEKPWSWNFRSWLIARLPKNSISPPDYYIDKHVLPEIEKWVAGAQETTDTKSPAQIYTPVTSDFVEKFYQDGGRCTLREIRQSLIDTHRPENALCIAVDSQVAFGAQPGSKAARDIITQRSFGRANLRELAEFIKQATKLKAWTVLTTMQQGGRTTTDRFQQQKALGLVGARDQFLLCPEASSDVMIHPDLLAFLGFNPRQITRYEYDLLIHTLSADVGTICSPGKGLFVGDRVGRYYSSSSTISDYLPVMVKPGRDLDVTNFRDIIFAGSTDIFLTGADIHVCVAELAQQLKLLRGKEGAKLHIWIVYDLATTRPKDFQEAQRVITKLADHNYFVFLCSSQEALEMLGRNRITKRSINNPSDDFPTFEDIVHSELHNLPAANTFLTNIDRGLRNT